jgi:cbb3-type cytochrome oxidase subunit 3
MNKYYEVFIWVIFKVFLCVIYMSAYFILYIIFTASHRKKKEKKNALNIKLGDDIFYIKKKV